ncbi:MULTISPECIES: DUF6571 family protein [unclassified Streptomyces]|uniref:DUF6571 family protein n=1 Tax=unclassified Streptomyces TaxID=2593676 RepID=UPI0004C48B3E|nr:MULTISPECIES: DUF6571 family protein [unclassified Streptomyces]KPC83786.1 hypothetical protein ADK82_06855 [Streptomyces sp. NRRL S-4]
MDFETLRFAKFGQLDTAVTDWATMVTNLASLKEDARDGLKKKADKADWSGDNANVTKGFVDKTVLEFDDAHKQAKSLWNILRDTRDELKSYRSQLDEAIERGLKKNLTVSANGGGGFTVSMRIGPSSTGTPAPADSESAMNALRIEIQNILGKATESDHTGSVALRALSDQAELGFTGAEYKDRDSADNAIKQADALAAIAKKDPADLTVKEFDKLNAGLKKMSGDELFSARFAEKLKAQGMLDFWTELNTPRPTDLQSARGDQYDELQKNLSLTLATATQSDSRGMTDWKRDMVDLGSQPIARGSNTVGFQVMSNLMRWGNFDNKFLDDYGNELIKAEKERTDNGRHGAWRTGSPMDPVLNRTGSDSGTDPMTGFMKALSSSPDAATEFFSDTFLTKEEDHEFKEDTDGDGKKGMKELSNFDYLFEERDWPKDYTNKGEDSISGRNNMALALEAATTGHPAGMGPPDNAPPHSAQQARLMGDIVASISDDKTRLTDNSYMGDSIGQIASEYLPDINQAMSDDPEVLEDGEAGKVNKLFPITGSPADINHRDATRFLLAVGQTPEGYARVELTQKEYMANLMDYHLNPDLPTDQRFSSDKNLTVSQIAYGTGEVSGTLAIGRQEEIAGDAEEKDKAYAHALTQTKGGISGTIGIGIGVGTSFIATPAVGAAVGGAAGTVSSMFLEGIFKDYEGEAKNEAGPVMAEHWENGRDKNFKHSQEAVIEAAKAHGIPLQDLATHARIGARDGFTDAGPNVEAMGPDLKTDV